MKSCRGIALGTARVADTGLADDRHWMLVRPNGHFVTQRELPRMALIASAIDETGLQVSARGMQTLSVPRVRAGQRLDVTVWKFDGGGIDCGDEAAGWFTQYLGTPLRLVSFDASQPRTCSPEWTGDTRAITEFADGYPVLVISRASLDDLNSRLPKALPMARFRPNLVIDGVGAYDEDRIHELATGQVTLRMVKPCMRCSITTTDQEAGVLDGKEPLATLKTYRYDRKLRGVCFGQNAIVVRGVGAMLTVGQDFAVTWKKGGSPRFPAKGVSPT